MKRLLAPPSPAEPSPATLWVWVALLLLLLPMLLLTTSPQKLTAISLRLQGGAGPSLSTGPLESVTVTLRGPDAEIVARVRRTDLGADAGEAEERRVTVPGAGGAPDLARLQGELARLRQLDDGATRVVLVPDDAASTASAVALLDAIRTRDGRPLFPDVVIGASP